MDLDCIARAKPNPVQPQLGRGLIIKQTTAQPWLSEVTKHGFGLHCSREAQSCSATAGPWLDHQTNHGSAVVERSNEAWIWTALLARSPILFSHGWAVA